MNKLFNEKKSGIKQSGLSNEMLRKFKLTAGELLNIKGGTDDPDGEGNTGKDKGELE